MERRCPGICNINRYSCMPLSFSSTTLGSWWRSLLTTPSMLMDSCSGSPINVIWCLEFCLTIGNSAGRRFFFRKPVKQLFTAFSTLFFFTKFHAHLQFGGYSSPPLNLVANYLRWSFPCNCVPIGPSVEANRHGLRLAFSRCSSIEKLGMDTPSARMMASFGRILRNVSVAKLSLRQFVLLEV